MLLLYYYLHIVYSAVYKQCLVFNVRKVSHIKKNANCVTVGFDFLKKEISDKAGLCTSRIYMGAPPFAVMLHIVCAYLLLIGNVFAVATGRKNKIYTGKVFN